MLCFYPLTQSQVLQSKHQERTEQTHNDSSLWPDVVVCGGVKSKQEAVSRTWCKTVCLPGISPSIISLANCRIQCIETKSPAHVFYIWLVWLRDAVFSLVSQMIKQIDKHRPSGCTEVCSESGPDWPCGLHKISQVWGYELLKYWWYFIHTKDLHTVYCIHTIYFK